MCTYKKENTQDKSNDNTWDGLFYVHLEKDNTWGGVLMCTWKNETLR